MVPVWRPVVSVTALMILLVAARPADAKVRGAIVNFGEVSGSYHPPDPSDVGNGLATGEGSVANRQYLNHSDRVEAALCRMFGATLLVTADAGEPVPNQIDFKSRQPEMTRPDGSIDPLRGFPLDVVDGKVELSWRWENRWELQPGEYVFEYWFQGSLLASKSFTVTGVRHPDSICEAAPVS